MKSPVKKQRGNAFHRGWPQAKESYLNSSSLEVQLFFIGGASHRRYSYISTICVGNIAIFYPGNLATRFVANKYS